MTVLSRLCGRRGDKWTEPRWVAGGLYWTQNDNGSYSVLKILDVSPNGVQVCLYSDQWRTPPTEVNERLLHIVSANKSPHETLGIGHAALSNRSFEAWKATFFQARGQSQTLTQMGGSVIFAHAPQAASEISWSDPSPDEPGGSERGHPLAVTGVS